MFLYIVIKCWIGDELLTQAYVFKKSNLIKFGDSWSTQEQSSMIIYDYCSPISNKI